VYTLIGKGTISTNNISTYSVIPALPSYFTYSWIFSDESLYMLKDTTRSFMEVLATNNTNNGILTCYIYQFGQPYDTLTFNIEVNRGYINIAELAVLDSACAAVYSLGNKCEQNFIDYFKLKEIEYINNGCVIGGFQDLTASGYTTNLEMGMTYTVEMKPNKLFFNVVGDTATLFYGIWIDYNNDGDFDDIYEFVKSGESNSSLAKLINISIANNKIYEGARRLRISMRSTGGFTEDDACSVIGESGEIEDYLVTLLPMGEMEGPNILTPNNDGNNDILAIKGVDADKERKLVVFSKSGSIVYEDEDYLNQWSGTGKSGELLPRGTYYYIFKNDSREYKTFLELDY